MNGRRLRPALACGLALATAGCTGTPQPSDLSVVLVTLDTTRADRIGAFGGKVPTPHLDDAAGDGVVFEQAYAQVPLTLPSHASVMTGRYPAAHGVRHNGIYRLREAETTLAETLHASGFETAAFVAAYVLNRGFGMEQGFGTYDDLPVNRFAGGQDQIFEAERSADDVNERVFAWLDHRQHEDRRFFLWVHYYDPHDPYAPPERAGRTLAGEGYDREVSYMDACFGDLLARLRRDGLLDRTLLVVAGDHGESLGEHGERTHGIFLYEGGVHVPLFLRAPGVLPEGLRVAGPVELVDIVPTVLDVLGLPVIPTAQGVSLRPRIEGRKGQALAYAETLMPRLEFGWSELRMVHDGRFKYVEAPVPELYDTRADPAEVRNLAANEPERRGEMATLLSGWAGATVDAAAASGAVKSLTAEEEAQLRSLGYLGGEAYKAEGGGSRHRPDPKAMIPEVRRLDDAREKLAGGDATGALAGADAVLATNPDNHQARTTRVLALLALGRLPEAEDEALQALGAAERDPEASAVLVQKARGLLASAFVLQGKHAPAKTQYRRMLAADPAHDQAAVDLARLLVRTGDLDQAKTLVDGVLSRDPGNGMALAARFVLEESAGDVTAARATALALARARAGDPPVLRRAARILLDAGRPADAVACLEVAQEQGELDPDLLGQLGAARIAAGQLERAEQDLGAVLRLRPGDPRAHYLLGTVALRRGREAEARAQFDIALRHAPQFTAPLVSLSRWLAQQGRREEAMEALREAERRNPSDTKAAAMLRQLSGG